MTKPSDITVEAFVPVRDYMECLPGIIQFFARQTVRVKLIIHDNGSTYGPLLGYLDALQNLTPGVSKTARLIGGTIATFPDPDCFESFEIIRGDNKGTHAVRLLHKDPELDYFITDADYDLSKLPDNTIEIFSRVLNSEWATNRPEPIQKVGSALALWDLPADAIQRDLILDREGPFWWDSANVSLITMRKFGLTDDTIAAMFHAEIDNTPGLLRKDSPFCYKPAIRIAGPYTARHVPWYITDLFKADPSYEHYLRNLDPSLAGIWSRYILDHFGITHEKAQD